MRREEKASAAPGTLGMIAVGAHSVRFLRDGAAAFPAMLEAIEGATREVLLEMYWFGADRVGKQFLAALVERHAPKLATDLQSLTADPALRGLALRSLAAYDETTTPEVILRHFGDYSPPEREDAIATLAARPAWAKALLEALGRGQIRRSAGRLVRGYLPGSVPRVGSLRQFFALFVLVSN